jgi:serine/threonine protein kinase
VPGGSRTEAPTLTPQGREIFERLKEATEGKYEVLRELGRGGMAVVFLCQQKSLDRLLAIKVLLPLLAYDPELVERFMREAKTQGRLDHPNIINVFEVYNESGLTFFTVPFISGKSLRSFLKDEPQPEIPKIRRYISQAADALSYAHKRGVVHRDVKPDNILIDAERDRVVLTDFGIAKALAAETTLTTPGDLLGTPQYMSPEQGEGRQDLDGRADQYSLGLIGWEMLTGRRPFQADNLAELMYKHRFEEPDELDDIRPDAPRNMRLAIKRAISKDRDERFKTMQEFLSAFEAADDISIELPGKKPEAPAGEDDTVLIPTPPSMRRKTADGVDRTAPESTEPSAAKEGGTDTTEPWTAPSGKLPWEEGDSGVAAEEDPETVLLGSLAERRKGPHMGLLVGGGAAAVVMVTLLFVVGPFKSGRQDNAPVESSEIVVPPGVEAGEDGGEGADLTGGPGTVPEEQVAEVETGDQGGQPQTPTDAGDQADAGGVEQPPVTVGDDPPTAGGGRDAELAASARGRTIDRRSAALAAGAAASFRPMLDSLDALLATADQQVAAARYGEARTLLSSLMLGYAALTDSARSASAAADSRNAVQAAADQSRLTALAQQTAVLSAGGAVFMPDELEALDGRLAEAQRAYGDNRFDEARDLYAELGGDYQALLARVKTQGEGAVAMALQTAREARRDARQVGADELAPEQLAIADRLRTRAVGAGNQERYGDAVNLFQQATDAYAQIMADLAAQPPAVTVSAEDQVRALVEQFRVLFEQEAIDRMGSDLYGGAVPNDDAELMGYVFNLAEDISATSTEEKLEVEGNSATAEIRLDLGFRNARDGRNTDMDLRLRLDFQSGPDGWRLRSVRRR